MTKYLQLFWIASLILPIAIGMRTAVNAEEVMDSSTEGKDAVTSAETTHTAGYNLPRLCDNSAWLFDHNCCSCAQPDGGGRRDQELSVWMDTCPWIMKGGGHIGKMCCPVWAVDCQPSDPWYQSQHEAECTPSKQECFQNECSDVHEKVVELESKVRSLQAQIESKSDMTQLASRWITDARDPEGMTHCHCGCGTLVGTPSQYMPDGSPQCAVRKNQTGVWCSSKTRDCCRSLKDCQNHGTENQTQMEPWHAMIVQDAETEKQRKTPLRAELSDLQAEVEDIKALRNTCLNDCKWSRKAQCVEKLKTIAKKGGAFGKDQTQQEVDEFDKWNAVYEAAKQSSEEAERERKQWERAQKAKRDREDAERNRERREHQLMKLGDFFKGVAGKVGDLVRGKQCCQCSMIEKNQVSLFTGFTKTVDICQAETCADFAPGPAHNGFSACATVSDRLCSRRPTACPADLHYYARGGERDY